MKGTLYVVATPIGNLKDITIRAIDTLKDVNIIIAENRERSLKLLSHLGIKKRIVAINSYNESRKAKWIVEQLLRGDSCAMISSAGTPCISDPGGTLLTQCIDAGIAVQPIPGPSAAICAMSVSGLSTDKFLFYGFLPQKGGKKRKILKELTSFPYPIVFFESPRRLLDTLRFIGEACGERQLVVCKEMTKLHEEVIRGAITEVAETLSKMNLKGEYTIILNHSEK